MTELVFNLFLAVLADPHAAEQMVDLREPWLRFRRQSARGIVPAECLHLSMHPIGCYRDAIPPSVVTAVKTSLDRCSFSATTVRLDRVMHFSPDSGDRSAVALVSSTPMLEFQRLRAQLEAAVLRRPSVATLNKSFQPHVTLFRDDSWFPDHAISPIFWKAREIVLVKSIVGQSRYEYLGRWWLQD